MRDLHSSLIESSVLSSPTTLTNIGNPTLEQVIEAPPLTERSFLLGESFSRYLPRCPIRRHFARNLADQLLELTFFRSILFAGYVSFRITAGCWDPEAQRGKTHPSDAIRMKGLCGSMTEGLRNNPWLGYAPEAFWSDAMRIVGAAEGAIAGAECREPEFDVADSVFRVPASADYFYERERLWGQIRPELARYARMPLAPPPDPVRVPGLPAA